MFRVIALGVVVAAGAWSAETWRGGSYVRSVDRPKAEVMASLAQMNFGLATTRTNNKYDAVLRTKRSVTLERADDHMTWTVRSGDDVAGAMTATFISSVDGKTTEVVASVQRGSVAGELVSPKFRSRAATMATFGHALEVQLNKLDPMTRRIDGAGRS